MSPKKVYHIVYWIWTFVALIVLFIFYKTVGFTSYVPLFVGFFLGLTGMMIGIIGQKANE